MRVIVFTGAGKGFSSGGDRDFLNDVTRMSPFEIKQAVYENFQGATKAVKLCPKPTIAAVNGAAIGAGCELALACDFRIAAESAYFLESWVHLGIIAPLGGMFLLPQLVGLTKATERKFSCWAPGWTRRRPSASGWSTARCTTTS